MKSRLLFSVTLLMGLLLGWTSCTPKDELELPSLTVEHKTLQFETKGGELSLTVTTNQDSWDAFCPESGQWIELQKAGNKLTVKTTANPTADLRKSYILISAGIATQAVSIVQQAGEVVLELLPETIDVPYSGGTYLFNVNTNDDHWKIEVRPSEDWIEVRSNPQGRFVQVVVKPNDTDKTREVVLVASSSVTKKTVEIPVTQVSVPEYTLPLFGQRIEYAATLIDYEMSIGNYFNKLVLSSPYVGPNNIYVFFPRKNLLERIYRVNAKTLVIEEIAETTYNTELLTTDESYIKFLISNGFVQTLKTDDLWTARNDEVGYTVSIEKYGKVCVITYTRIIEQPQAYPTFETLPVDVFFAHVGDNTATAEKIKAAEIAAGSTNFVFSYKEEEPHKGEITIMSCDVDPSKRPHIGNAYFFGWGDKIPAEKRGTLLEKATLYSKPELVFWTDKASKKIYVTKEIRELMTREGWTLDKETEGVLHYMKEGRYIGFRYVVATDINGGKPVLMVHAGFKSAE